MMLDDGGHWTQLDDGGHWTQHVLMYPLRRPTLQQTLLHTVPWLMQQVVPLHRGHWTQDTLQYQ